MASVADEVKLDVNDDADVDEQEHVDETITADDVEVDFSIDVLSLSSSFRSVILLMRQMVVMAMRKPTQHTFRNIPSINNFDFIHHLYLYPCHPLQRKKTSNMIGLSVLAHEQIRWLFAWPSSDERHKRDVLAANVTLTKFLDGLLIAELIKIIFHSPVAL